MLYWRRNKTGSLHINWWDQIWGKQRSGKVLMKVITSFTWNKSNLMPANRSRHWKSLRLGHMRKITLWKIPVQTQYTWDWGTIWNWRRAIKHSWVQRRNCWRSFLQRKNKSNTQTAYNYQGIKTCNVILWRSHWGRQQRLDICMIWLQFK